VIKLILCRSEAGRGRKQGYRSRIRGKRGNGEGRGNKKPFKTFKVSHENGRSECRQALTGCLRYKNIVTGSIIPFISGYLHKKRWFEMIGGKYISISFWYLSKHF